MIDPIRRSVAVRCSVEAAFRVFTTDMSSWWPLDVHSRAADEREGVRSNVKAERVVLEPWVGGRLFEVMSDGNEGSWGTVLAWEPPHRLTIAWKPNDNPNPATELEVKFIERDGGGTRVELEHRGWERLGDLARESREAYMGGWPRTFDVLFAEAANAEGEEG
jgi:uncharacterized protein YndB with AHSA1/START domain